MIKFCECGCGLLSPIAKMTSKRQGAVKGEPQRYIAGHNRRGCEQTEQFKKAVSKKLKGRRSPNWKGGQFKLDGYVYILKPEHPHATKQGYVLQHHLIMEEYLGRYLDRGEVPHHIDETRDNNSIENLELCLDGVHKSFSVRKFWIDRKAPTTSPQTPRRKAPHASS